MDQKGKGNLFTLYHIMTCSYVQTQHNTFEESEAQRASVFKTLNGLSDQVYQVFVIFYETSEIVRWTFQCLTDKIILLIFFFYGSFFRVGV